LEKARKDQQAAKKAAGNAAQAPVDCMEVDDGSGDDEPPELDAVSSSLEGQRARAHINIYNKRRAHESICFVL